jgi:hypothetical protein
MILEHLVDHPCHGAAAAVLPELVAVAHGQPIEARDCVDGAIALEIWGADWRVLLCLEANPAESGWSWVRANPARVECGKLDNIAQLSALIESCLGRAGGNNNDVHECEGER